MLKKRPSTNHEPASSPGLTLGIEIDRYVGVDANKAPIDWLRAHVADSRFRFEWLDLANTMYNLHGRARARA